MLWPRKHWSWSEDDVCKCLPYSLICRNKDIQCQKRNEQDLYVYFTYIQINTYIYTYVCSSSSNLNLRDSMLLWSVQENAILYQSASVIQLHKCDSSMMWSVTGSWSSPNKRTHLVSEKIHKRTTFPNIWCIYLMICFFQNHSLSLCGWKLCFKPTKMETFSIDSSGTGLGLQF